jgi:N-acyl-D-amino-acid deacylase
MIDDAVASGVDVAFDRYPYTASSTGLSSFISLRDRQGSRAEVIARLNDPQKIKEFARSVDSRLKRIGGPQNIIISSSRLEENRKYVGKNLQECSELSNMEIPDFIRNILISENMNVSYISFSMSEDNLNLLYAHPLAMPGSDGSVNSANTTSNSLPHPRAFGTFTRFLSKYVREKKVIDLQTAIYKMCALPASRLQIKDRGMLIPGYRADVVVFNPATVCELSTYAQPRQYNTGIEHVFVNGVWTVKREKHTGALAGSVIRRET